MTFTIYAILAIFTATLFGAYLVWRDIELNSDAVIVTVCMSFIWPALWLVVFVAIGYNSAIYIKKRRKGKK